MAASRRPKVDIMTKPAEPAADQDAKAPVALTDTPEFASAVSSAVDRALGPILERIAQMNGAPPVAGDAQSLFQQMALAIAEISDQGSDRKRVAPEILAARAAAHKRMVAAILEAKRAHEKEGLERPLYRAIGKMYLNERFIEPFVVDPVSKQPKAVEFRWSGPPNEVMRPLNEPAKEIFRHYRDSIGSIDAAKAETALWVSAGGLVIEGEGPSRRQVAGLERRAVGFDDDLEVASNSNPAAPFVSVLGTIAAQARQNYGDSAFKRA